MGLRSAPAPFVTKTYQLVDDLSTNDVISWSENGTSFIVWKSADFVKDLLPNYFKHNNFSSFVRQLNTYGFRKVVPHRWEFMNENFRRGKKELLSKIRRRKTAKLSSYNTDGKTTGARALLSSNSSEGRGSTSNLSPDWKNPGSVETASMNQSSDLSDENEKLKKDNEILISELAKMKRQCEVLIAFLTEYVKVRPDQISNIMREGSGRPNRDGGCDHEDDGNEKDDEEGRSLKLFGVWLKAREKKRRRQENIGFAGGPQAKEMKTEDFHHAPLVKNGKVCN
ncbi:hypothetical protein SLE2022_362350 [Rubroshorea leprosula]